MPFLRFMPILIGVCLIGALSDVSIADAPEWEKRFRAVQKIQDGEIQGLLEKKQPLDSLIGRYTSRFQMERTALNAGLVGRLLVFQGLQMQQPHQRDAKFATALKYFAEAIRLQPSFWFARLGSTQIYLFRNDIDRADRALAPAVRQKPNEPGVMEMQVQVLLLRERYAPALELLRRLLRLDPKAYKFHAMEAEILWYQARWAESAAKFEWLIRLPSETPLLRMNEMEWRRRAGLCYMQLEDHSRAERHLGRVVRAFPDKLSVRAALELCYLKLNKPRALLQQVDWLMGYFQREIQKAQSTGSTGQDAGRAKMLGEQLEIYRRKRAEVIDQVAAAYILQGALDRIRHLRG